MKSYPFVNCISPVLINHRSTKEPILVGCGKCCACRNAKNGNLALKCKLESKSNAYSYFITLTYNQDYIPLMRAYPVYGEKGQQWMFVSVCDRLEERGLIINECSYSKAQIDQLSEKVNLGGLFPYLSSRDAQLFVKRLRKHISKISDENIRFFLCGEFGPKSLRPHFHVILWFNDRQIAENLENIVNQSWQFGYTDCQAVRDDVASYVAGYLNSAHTLPRLYQAGKSQPFANHSQLLGEDVLACEKEEVYKLTPSDFVRRSMQLGDTFAEFSLWRSIKNRFYPKCRDFVAKSHDERYRIYTIIDCVQGRQTAHRKPLQIACEIVEFILLGNSCGDLAPLIDYYDHLYKIFDLFHTEPSQRIDLYTDDEYAKYMSNTPVYISSDDMDIRIHMWLIRVTNMIYADLLISDRFVNFVCDGITNPVHRHNMLRMIENFYADLELRQLGNFYLQQKEYVDEFGFTENFKDLFYNESIYELTESEVFKIFKADAMYTADQRQKHKRQNDANRYWFKERDL